MCFRAGGNSQQGVPGGIDDMVQVVFGGENTISIREKFHCFPWALHNQLSYTRFFHLCFEFHFWSQFSNISYVIHAFLENEYQQEG